MKPLGEGAINKFYTISTPSDSGVESQFPYVFRIALPVEPLYGATDEVMTLSYVLECASFPVPRVA